MNGNKPTHKVQFGSVSVAVWSNDIETGNGTRTVQRVTAERRYKDKDGTWKSTGSFSATTDLNRLILALQKAQEYVLMNPPRKGEDEGGDENGLP
ncbi:MAG TPA: hypothetical protein PKY77_10860 [Phycisphaerae bacterium]|nr:hypothetical protein [Phycisphaerae bacterium]HRY70081.1 hypothetical protein [Phycisphaerae bacterium]HSA27357.1 hypothetical protein [Phycisphaerae bacterium]